MNNHEDPGVGLVQRRIGRMYKKHPWLRDALLMQKPRIIQSFSAYFSRTGKLSERQMQVLKQIYDDHCEGAAPAPTGVCVYTGKITRAYILPRGTESYRYATKAKLCIVVSVPTPAGRWMAWSLAPNRMVGDVEQLEHLQILADTFRGQTVTMRGTLRQGDEPHFAVSMSPELIKIHD